MTKEKWEGEIKSVEVGEGVAFCNIMWSGKEALNEQT